MFLVPDWMLWIMMFLFFMWAASTSILFWLYWRHCLSVYTSLLQAMEADDYEPKAMHQMRDTDKLAVP